MANKMTGTITASCPGCDNEINFDRLPELGTFVTCLECGDLVEVVNLLPLALDWSADIYDNAWPEYEDDFGDFNDIMDDYGYDYASDFDEEFVD